MIGKRLQEERRAKGLSQADLLQITGAARRTVIDWEKGVSSPTGVQLAALAAADFDVLYILTGQRVPGAASAPVLTRREAALLDNYRNSSEDAQAALDKTSAAFAQPAAPDKRSRNG